MSGVIRVKNVQQGFVDSQGRFHPIRGSADYDEGRTAAGYEKLQKQKRAAAARKAAGTRRAKTKVVAMPKRGVTKGRRRNPGYSDLDVTQRDLYLYIENNSVRFRDMLEAVQKNLANKRAAGKYNRVLAVKAFASVATEGAKSYAREFANPRDWNTIFTVADRKAVAEAMRDEFEDDYEDGQFSGMLHKKYASKRANPVKGQLPRGVSPLGDKYYSTQRSAEKAVNRFTSQGYEAAIIHHPNNPNGFKWAVLMKRYGN